MREYDIIASGGGSGGIATMNRAGEHGAKAAVIEEKKLGGTCVNVGCVPKKIMWYGAQIAETFHQFGEDYGFKTTDLNFDFATLRRNREAYIDRARSSYDGSFKRNGVDLIEGHAEFVDSHTVSVNGELIRAKHIVIATGAHPSIPNIPGAELGGSSDDVFAWEELPESVAILGAGYIAFTPLVSRQTSLFAAIVLYVVLTLTSLKVWLRKWKEQTCHFILTKSLLS